jgi:broad specificity phosphatase PhoE
VQAGAFSEQLLAADVLVTSPHIRCLQTLKHLGTQRYKNVIVCDHFGEFNRDELQNALPSFKELTYFLAETELVDAKIDMDAEHNLENADLASQALKALATIQSQTIVILTHRVVIRELTGRDIANCQVVECELDNGSIENIKN